MKAKSAIAFGNVNGNALIKLQKLIDDGQLAAGVVDAAIRHDDWCRFLKSEGSCDSCDCDCDPDIELKTLYVPGA